MCLAHLSCLCAFLMCFAFGCCQKLRLLASICFQIPTNFSSSWHRSNFSLLDFNRLPTVKFLVIVDFSRFRPFLCDLMHFVFLIITPFRVGAQKCILAPSRSIYPNTHFSSPPQKHLCRESFLLWKPSLLRMFRVTSVPTFSITDT